MDLDFLLVGALLLMLFVGIILVTIVAYQEGKARGIAETKMLFPPTPEMNRIATIELPKRAPLPQISARHRAIKKREGQEK
jgi:hypothetical protein